MLKRRMDALPLNPIVLLVLDGNKKAAEFYRKKGFVFTGRKLKSFKNLFVTESNRADTERFLYSGAAGVYDGHIKSKRRCPK